MSENRSGGKNYPYEILTLNPDINRGLRTLFTGEHREYVVVGPQKYILPSTFENVVSTYYNFEVRPDDTWIVTFPRSGTTLSQEMVWLIENNYDYETAAKIKLTQRFPFLEYDAMFLPLLKTQLLKEATSSVETQDIINSFQNLKMLQQRNGKRFIKSHLPLSLLPPNLLTSGCKVIYVARNPKDVVVSFHHFFKLLTNRGYTGDFPSLVDYFLRDLIFPSPFWSHLREGWVQRYSKNVLLLFYEEITTDMKNSIRKVANFLEKHINEEQLLRLEDHLQIDTFRKNKSVNSDNWKDLGTFNQEGEFIRQGRVGSWNDECTDDNLNKKMNEWMQRNMENINANRKDFVFWN